MKLYYLLPIVLMGCKTPTAQAHDKERKCVEWHDWKHPVIECTREKCTTVGSYMRSDSYVCYCSRYENLEINDPYCSRWSE